ncbi:MAG: flagellar export chaperone FlgN [Phycisphaeraceae bacterium]|nr:flagellar export chaperone FlgN [Phycisphaeraceae bacterium]
MDKQLAELERLLEEQTACHQAMLEVILQKHQAIRKFQCQALENCCRRENQFLQRVAELEKARQRLVAEMTLALDPAATAPLALKDLAERFAEPMRGRLLVRRVQLRQAVEQTQAQANIARRATESLLRHMQGLMQTLGSMMTGVGVYGQRGDLPRGALAMSTFSATA